MGKALGPAIKRAMKRGQEPLLKELRERTRAKRKVDTRAFIRGWRAKVVGYKVTFSNVERHAGNVEYGRRAGAQMPPVSVISEWARRKLGNARLGWPIAKAIARRGIRPTPILTSKAFAKKVKQVMNREIAAEVARVRRNG